MSTLTAADRSPALATTDRGSGEPALLFIPGWCGDRSVFVDLLGHAGKRRRAVSVDLPSHGASAYVGDVTSAQVVDALEGTIRALGMQRVVPVALSHAGWFAIDLRRRLGAETVPGIVVIDWMVLGAPPEFQEALAGLQSPDWEQVRRGLHQMWIAGLDIPALTAYLHLMAGYGQGHWNGAGREISASFAAQPVPLEALDALQPCPTLHVYAQPADPAVLEAQQAYSREHPWFEVHRLDAQSHFPMFEAPDDLAYRIEQFVAKLR